MSPANKNLFSKAIATAADKNFAPWLLNFIGSIQSNYPNYPQIYIYDLGLGKSFLKELNSIKNVTVKNIPPFVLHWRACYTWKTWILNDIPGDIVYYIDSATEILKPLDEIFEIINTLDYFIVSQSSFGDPLNIIVSTDLLKRLNLPQDFPKNKEYFWAGGFGYKKNTLAHRLVKEMLNLAIEGWTLGWSKSEIHRRLHVLLQM